MDANEKPDETELSLTPAYALYEANDRLRRHMDLVRDWGAELASERYMDVIAYKALIAVLEKLVAEGVEVEGAWQPDWFTAKQEREKETE